MELFVWVLLLACLLNHFCIVKYFFGQGWGVILKRCSFAFLSLLETQNFRFSGDCVSLGSGVEKIFF